MATYGSEGAGGGGRLEEVAGVEGHERLAAELAEPADLRPDRGTRRGERRPVKAVIGLAEARAAVLAVAAQGGARQGGCGPVSVVAAAGARQHGDAVLSATISLAS